ncbi:thioredoxin-dependent thiol peroxidase [bacterium]|jgi:thioredoxin-dependent peroxiredoxin|nr:thioredoxin-dependent thiol peroxidase [bacterium]
MLEIGQKALSFSLSNENDETITLDSLKGKKVVLFFYPKDATPGCTREGNEFSEKKTEFDSHNTVVLGVSKDSVASHKRFCEKQGFTVSLLSDPEGDMVEDYGVWQEKKNYGRTYMGIVRSTYLIDESGMVAHVWSPVKVAGHVDAVLERVSENG